MIKDKADQTLKKLQGGIKNMVFKKEKKVEEKKEPEVPIEDEDLANPDPKQVEDKQVVEVPIFLTKADIQRMVYENNVMLRQLVGK